MTTTKAPSLRNSIKQALEQYFSCLEDSSAANLYNLVINEVEAPLLSSVLDHTKGNQSLAARVLGISRTTLRKKLEEHELE